MAISKTSERFSDRSQQSFLDEFRLMEEIGKVESVKRLSEQRLESFQKDKERLVRASAEGNPAVRVNLGICIREIQEEEGKIAAYSEHIGSLTSQIAALRKVTPEQLSERRSHQEVLLSASRQRLNQDRQIDKALQQLRALLTDRNELTAKMKSEASAIGLNTDLDGERCQELLALLPDSILPSSQAWSKRFLDEREESGSYVICIDHVVLSETLTHSGVYFAGETVRLTHQEAASLMREHGAGSIITESDYVAASDRAERANLSVKELLLWRELSHSKSSERTKDSKLSQRTMKIRVRAKSPINHNGVYYAAGEEFAIYDRKTFWGLADAGVIEPPAGVRIGGA